MMTDILSNADIAFYERRDRCVTAPNTPSRRIRLTFSPKEAADGAIEAAKRFHIAVTVKLRPKPKRKWPTLSRSQLLARLAMEGHLAAQHAHDERRQRRLAAIRRHSGMLTGAYGPHYLDALRQEWPA